MTKGTAMQVSTGNVLLDAIKANLAGSGTLRLLNKDTGEWEARTWAALYERSEAIAARLLDEDETPGAPIAVLGEPRFDGIAALCGAWLAGRAATVIAGPNRFAGVDIWAGRTRSQLASLGISHLFGQGTGLAALADAGAAESVRLIGAETVGSWRSARSSFQPRPTGSADVAVYQGTAGSTGSSKTVILSAESTLNHLNAVVERQKFDRGSDVLCSWLPLYHDMGLTMLLGGLLTGADTWLAPTSAFAKAPFDWLDWLTESRATVTAAPNFAYALLGRYARVAKNADLGSLRFAVNGGEPIDVEASERFGSELARFGFPRESIAASYGLAEAACGVTMPAPSSGLRFDVLAATATAPERKVALLGEPLDGVEVRLRDSAHAEGIEADRAVGEVEFRSTGQMSGYLGDPAIPADEWISTGDLGYLVDGQLVVCGRSKELIMIGGRNIFPHDVERAVDTVAGVRAGNVVALSAAGGRVGSDRLIVVAEFAGADREAARGEIAARTTAECGITPALVELVEPNSLPKTSSGKLRRVEVAQRYR